MIFVKEKIKVGVVGLGRRGDIIVQHCLAKMADVDVVTICDGYEPYLEKTAKYFDNEGKKRPKFTTNYDDIVNDEEIDAVVILTGWEDHIPLAKKAMRKGKYTAIEVGCAFDLNECFELLEIHEQTGAQLMMLENCCYGRYEMMALNMVKQGLFGEIVHCDGGYRHNLIDEELFKAIDDEHPHYRINSYIHRNCEQYPTHELGPICKVLNINRGNRLMKLSSFASKAAGLKEGAKRVLGADSKWANIDYKQGDIVTTVITCANGETIRLTLDTTLPRPYYSRDFTVRGTKGLCSEERNSVVLEGMAEPVENNLEEMYEKYDHPLWKEYTECGISEGHGGMDWLLIRAFVESVKNNTAPPIDIFDTLTMLSIAPLSEASISCGGMPVEIPDFTRGRWISREPVVKGKYCLNEICEDKSVPIYPEKK